MMRKGMTGGDGDMVEAGKPHRILYEGGTAEIIEKKSRFIAQLRPVRAEEEALAFLEEVRKQHREAKHHCYAWILGEEGQSKRCSDDGEPSQTAGRPMLDVLEGESLTGICAVVTRYFGGTLLGTGGLVRAYSGALQAGLLKSTVLDVYPARKTDVDLDYGSVGKIQYMLGAKGLTVLESAYGQRVMLKVLVPEEDAEDFRKDVAELTGGKAELKALEPVYYGVLNQKILLF